MRSFIAASMLLALLLVSGVAHAEALTPLTAKSLPPMREYLASPELQDAPPSVVVWEIPERYVPVAETP